jgi:hypothetical protein
MPTQNYQHVRHIMLNDYKDYNFCSVVAVATAFNISAGRAHRLLAKKGRVNRRGPEWSWLTDVIREEAKRHGKYASFTKDWDGVTINQFKKAHPTGTWILAVKGHVLTLKDGEFQDWTADTAGRRKIGYRSAFHMDGQAFGVCYIGE